jgi:SAM-dependent methyltransferase
MTPEPVHPAAAIGFDRQAAAYAAVRPSYPAGAVAVLADELGFGPGSKVCDLAAGTGIYTRLLVAAGYDVVAVEPVAGMRRELAASTPGVEIVDGTAEQVPLEDGSVEVVTVAQAFHWFDPEASLAEIHRVLASQGGLQLVWNVRDESVDWVRTLTDLIHSRSGGRPYDDHREQPWHDIVAAAGGFTPLLSRRFWNPVAATPETVVERVRSTSFVAAMDPGPMQDLLDDVAELVATHPETRGLEQFDYPHHTDVYWCHRAA